MKIIYFMGPDGSGKTTLAKSLAENFSNRRIEVRLAWMRGTHTLASLLARLLRKFRNMQGEENPYYRVNIPSKMKPLWHLIEVISIIPIVVRGFLIPKYLGYAVIGERSPLDFLAWLIMTTNDANILGKIYARIILAFVLETGIPIYIKAEPSILVKRRSGELSRKSARKQAAIYNSIAYLTNAFIVDTSSTSIQNNLERIKSHVNNLSH